MRTSRGLTVDHIWDLAVDMSTDDEYHSSLSEVGVELQWSFSESLLVLTSHRSIRTIEATTAISFCLHPLKQGQSCGPSTKKSKPISRVSSTVCRNRTNLLSRRGRLAFSQKLAPRFGAQLSVSWRTTISISVRLTGLFLYDIRLEHFSPPGLCLQLCNIGVYLRRFS
jgi:hypothetical protein